MDHTVEAKPKHGRQYLNRIFEKGHLLPLGERPRYIVYGYFEGNEPALDQLNHEFNVKVEPVAMKSHTVDAVLAKNFEHGPWIYEMLAVHRVEDKSQHLVTEI
jgi:hypothetical protein